MSLCAVLLFVVACQDAGRLTRSAVPGPNFSGQSTSFSLDGMGETQITTDPAHQGRPAISGTGSSGRTSAATFAGSVEICIDYSGSSYGNESQLTLLHFDETTGAWEDVTTSLDRQTTTICGVTEDIVYDNQMGSSDDSDASTKLGGGSIVIHTI